jgi:Domain of unknown function (DUF4432)
VLSYNQKQSNTHQNIREATAVISGIPTDRAALRPLVGDLRQLASVRRIVLDDGAERGVRALAFSPGGGLDFWVLSDRPMDIGPLWFQGMQLGWQAPTGFTSAALLNRLDDGGRGVERLFSGLLMTCGLEHLRQPEGGVLHGHLPMTPANVTAYGEDWDACDNQDRPEPVLFCEGEITQARVNGEALRLHRRIEALIGTAKLRIVDRVENLGPAPQPFGLMHHVNFGFPLVCDGTRLALDGETLLALDPQPSAPPLTCREVQPGWRRCTIDAPLADRRLTVTLGFDGEVQGFLQLWHNLAAGTRVIAMEPCTSGRMADGRMSADPVLEAGESRIARLELSCVLD